MEENKPIQTDPSDAVESNDDNRTLDEIVAERVAEFVAKQQPQKTEPVSNETASQGGSGSDVSPQKDSTSNTDPNVEVLKFAKEVLNRDFTSVDDVKKTISNLNSLVGDQTIAKAREEAKLYSAFVEKFAAESNQSVEEAKKFLADTLLSGDTLKKSVAETNPKGEDSKVAAEIEVLRSKQERMELLAKYPEAAEVSNEIAIIAKQKGISQMEAYEASPLKQLVETKAKEESRKSPVVTSSNRVGMDSNKIKELGARALKTNSESDKIALVKALGLSK